MAKRVRAKPVKKEESSEDDKFSMGYKIFRDAHMYLLKKYPKATIGDFNEAVAWEILEQDASTHQYHPTIDTEDLDETLNRVVMGRENPTQTNTLVRIAAIASALLQQNKENLEKKAKDEKK